MDYDIVEEVPVTTTRLDDMNIEDVDLLKIDVQGSELNILQNGRELYQKASMIDTEAMFIQAYENQPLFSDIELELRNHGFMFHKFVKLFSRQLVPCLYDNDLLHDGSQMLWAQSACFIKPLLSLDQLYEDKLIKMAFIAHEIWQSYDLAMMIFHHLDMRFSISLLPRYMQYLNQQL